MTAEDAIQIATQHFPDGLTKIAEILGAAVHYSKMSVDGWCIRNGDGSATIRISSNKPPVRQKFTLAHEVAHLIRGTSTDILRGGNDPFDPKKPEEQAANELASQLLLPLPNMKALTGDRPIDRKTIRHVAKKAGVSEVVVALRYVKLHDTFGLNNATVVHFQEGKCRWKQPKSRQLDVEWAFDLYGRAGGSSGRVALVESADDLVLACALCGDDYPVLFYHQLSPEQVSDYHLTLPGEHRKRLEKRLFGGDDTFRNKLTGMFGGFRNRALTMSYSDAVHEFMERYRDRASWNTDDQLAKFLSAECQEYVCLRLAEYCQSED